MKNNMFKKALAIAALTIGVALPIAQNVSVDKANASGESNIGYSLTDVSNWSKRAGSTFTNDYVNISTSTIVGDLAIFGMKTNAFSNLTEIDFVTNQNLTMSPFAETNPDWKFEALSICAYNTYPQLDAASGIPNDKNSVSLVWGWTSGFAVIESDNNGNILYNKSLGIGEGKHPFTNNKPVSEVDDPNILYQTPFFLFNKSFEVKVNISETDVATTFSFNLITKSPWGHDVDYSFTYTSTNPYIVNQDKAICYSRNGKCGDFDGSTHYMHFNGTVTCHQNINVWDATSASGYTLSGGYAFATANPSTIYTNDINGTSRATFDFNYISMNDTIGGFSILFSGNTDDYSKTTIGWGEGGVTSSATGGDWIGLFIYNGGISIRECNNGTITTQAITFTDIYSSASMNGYAFWGAVGQNNHIVIESTEIATGVMYNVWFSVSGGANAENIDGYIYSASFSSTNSNLKGPQKYRIDHAKSDVAPTTSNNKLLMNVVADDLIYTATIGANDSSYGSVSQSSVTDIPYGTSYSTNGNVLTIGTTDITATAATATAQYTYAFSSWSVTSGTFTSDMTITANFTRTTNNYTVTVSSNNTTYGNVDVSSVPNVPYGTSFSTDGNKLTIGTTVITATPSTSTATDVYSFSGWSETSGTITANTSITANFTRSDPDKYTVSISVNDSNFGSVSQTSIANVISGTAITVNGNELTIGSTTVTATPKTATAEYTYVFSGWGTLPSTVTEDMNIIATFAANKNKYDITIAPNDSSYGSVNITSLTDVEYGTPITVSGTTLTIGTTVIVATAATATSDYTYAFESWSVTSGIVTGAHNIIATFSRTAVTKYTATINVNEAGYGSVSPSSVTNIAEGTSYSTNGNILTIGTTQVVATPSTNTAQYTYAFSSWDVTSGTISSDVTITATFTRTTNKYNITIASNDSSYGTVSITSLTDINYGTSITINNNKLTIGATTITATPSENTYDYNYSFSSWSVEEGIVTGNLDITATFIRSDVTKYVVTVSVGQNGWGSVSQASVTNLIEGISYSTNGNQLIINTATPTTVTATPTAKGSQYNYTFLNWTDESGNPITSGTISGNITIKANFEQHYNTYTISFSNNNPTYGSLDKTSIVATHGDSISASNNVLTIGSTSITATPETATAQYTYSFLSWSITTGTITEDTTIYVSFSRATNKYTVTITSNNNEYGSVDVTSIADVEYGSPITINSNILTIKGINVTATPTASTSDYTYSFSSWTTGGSTVTGAVEIVANFARQAVDKYRIDFLVNEGSYGSVSVSTITDIPSGSAFIVSGNKITVNSQEVVATPSANTAQYIFEFVSWDSNSGTVTSNLTITATFSREVKKYTVTISSNNLEYGDVDTTSIVNVAYGTAVTVSQNTVTVGSKVVTATASDNTVDYIYAFVSWNVETGTISGDLDIIATFSRTEVTKYTLTIEINETGYGSTSKTSITNILSGTVFNTSGNVLYINGEVVTATASDKTAQYTYAFASWSLTSGVITENTTITANFTRTLNTYRVDILVNNDCGSVDVTVINEVSYGTLITLNNNKVIIGETTITATPNSNTAQYTYAFVSWDGIVASVTGNLTLTANFSKTINTYTVTITVNNAGYGNVNINKVEDVPYGTAVSVDGNKLFVGSTQINANPSLDTADYHYSFVSWSVNYLTIEGNLTVLATFARECETTYTVVFMNDGQVTNTVQVKHNNVVEKPLTDPTKKSTAQYEYIFEYWAISGNEDNMYIFTTPVTSDLTITAVYKDALRIYSITFDVDNSNYKQTNYNYGDNIVKPDVDPYKAADKVAYYIFTGWYDSPVGGSKCETFGTVSKNYTYYAHFDTYYIEYSVVFMNDNNVYQNKSLFYGAQIIPPTTTPTKVASDDCYFVFDGWYDSLTATTKVTTFGSVTGDVTYYARYNAVPNTFVVTFNTDGGNLIDTQYVKYGDKVSKPADPTKDSYKFKGWYVGDEKYDFNTEVSSNFEITAKWDKVNNEATMMAIIITSSVIGGLALIGIGYIFVSRTYKKRKKMYSGNVQK